MITEASRGDRSACCKSPGAATPLEIWNRPALSAIKYRVGTYSSFKRSMVDAISKDPSLRGWTARSSDDFGIAFLDMWAYLSDILTFYQERIANEAYLRTAILPESVLMLARLLDYRPSPGAAASVDLAFTVDKGREVAIPKRLKVQSVPGQNELPQKFETVELLLAYASLNEMRLKATVPQVLKEGSTRAIISGIKKGLKPGDYALVVGEERLKNPGSERWELRMISEVEEDLEKQTTTIRWKEGLGHKFPRILPPSKPRLFAFRQRAYPFGHDAVDWYLIPKSLREPLGKNPLYPDNWNIKDLPEDPDHRNQIFLDSVYSSIQPESWVALITSVPPKGHPSYPGYAEIYRVLEVAETARSGYMITSTVTRLTVDEVMEEIPKEAASGKETESVRQPEHIHYFPLRSTTILAQSDLMYLAEEPISDPLSGNRLLLDGYFPELQEDRKLVLVGNVASRPREVRMEIISLDQIDANQDRNETALTLKSNLTHSYMRDSVRIYGNIASATHGETVEEVLGDGDAGATFQTFSIHKSPVTFIREAEALHGVASTLEIRAGGILWQEARDLYSYSWNDRIYITKIDCEGKMSISFGDGVTGARLPTGRSNVIASFRKGLGRGGNVRSGSLTNLLDKPVGLRSVTNPVSASGGVDPEAMEQIRANAPNKVRTFDRVISLKDFEDAAREYAGIAKARARMVWNGEEEEVSLVVAADDDASLEPDEREKLYQYLNARRDTNRKLRIVSRRKVPVVVEAEVKVRSDYLEKNVLDSASKALRSFFAFENLDIGENIYLSDIYRALQDVEGVTAARISKLQRKSEMASGDISEMASGDVRERLMIGPEELASIEEPGDISVVPWR